MRVFRASSVLFYIPVLVHVIFICLASVNIWFSINLLNGVVVANSADLNMSLREGFLGVPW